MMPAFPLRAGGRAPAPARAPARWVTPQQPPSASLPPPCPCDGAFAGCPPRRAVAWLRGGGGTSPNGSPRSSAPRGMAAGTSSRSPARPRRLGNSRPRQLVRRLRGIVPPARCPGEHRSPGDGVVFAAGGAAVGETTLRPPELRLTPWHAHLKFLSSTYEPHWYEIQSSSY